MKKLIIFGTLALVLGGLGYYSKNKTAELIPDQTLTEDWKIYSDQSNSFSFKFPRDYIVVENTPGIIEINNANNIYFGMIKYKSIPENEKIVAKGDEGDYEVTADEQILIDGYEAHLVINKGLNDGYSGIRFSPIYLNNNKQIEFFFSYPTSSDGEMIVRKLLESFKFTK